MHRNQNLKKACLLLICCYFTTFVFEFARKRKIKEDQEVICHGVRYKLKRRSCSSRFNWITSHNHLNNYNCFQQKGLNHHASDCDVIRYLVFVEGVCSLPENAIQFFQLHLLNETKMAILRPKTDFHDLLLKLTECGDVCSFMQKRIESMNDLWIESMTRISRNDVITTTNKPPMKILLHMGLLTKEMGLNFGMAALHGGPLGELVQWSDLMATLHLLGHDVTLSWSPERLEKLLGNIDDFNGCLPTKRKFDLVFTDVNGVSQMMQTLGSLHDYRCVLRVLDVFGTEAEFNHPLFNPNKHQGGDWGGRGLNLAQFFTHFPHSPDNSFLGFVVAKQPEVMTSRLRDRALLYGKRREVLRGRKKEEFLELIRHQFPDVHVTMEGKVSDDIINHGNVDQETFLGLLRSAKLFVGFESPIEGPAALEAISQGAVFLNPKFDPPKSLDLSKPTRRKIKSQNPFAEEFIGEPFVYTINIRNHTDVNRVLSRIQQQPANQPFVPHQFTFEGFIERVNGYVSNQDFCPGEVKYLAGTMTSWIGQKSELSPSLNQIKTSKPFESCTASCKRHKLICEPSFFSKINNYESFQANNVLCSSFRTIYPRKELESSSFSLIPTYLPSLDLTTNECLIQSDYLLFSCASHPPKDMIRLCPCKIPQK